MTNSDSIPNIESRERAWKNDVASISAQQTARQRAAEAQQKFLAALVDAAEKAGLDVRGLIKAHSEMAQASFDEFVKAYTLDRPDIPRGPKVEGQ